MSFFTTKTDDTSSGPQFNFICKTAGEDLSDLEEDPSAPQQQVGATHSFFSFPMSENPSDEALTTPSFGVQQAREGSNSEPTEQVNRQQSEFKQLPVTDSKPPPKPRRPPPAPPQVGRPPRGPQLQLVGDRIGGTVRATPLSNCTVPGPLRSVQLIKPPQVQKMDKDQIPKQTPAAVSTNPGGHGRQHTGQLRGEVEAEVEAEALTTDQQVAPTIASPPPPVQGIGFETADGPMQSGGAHMAPRSDHSSGPIVDPASATAQLAAIEKALFRLGESFRDLRCRCVDGALELAVIQNE